MKFYCFIQARYSSKRLRGKVLKKIGRLTLLEILIRRLKKSKKISKIVVLTSSTNTDQKIVSFCKKKKIHFFCGSLNNVFFRFKSAIKKYKPEKVIRISADSPLMDWRLIDKMILFSNNKKSFDLISNIKYRTFPKGQSVEILNPKIFNLSSKILSKNQKEHVTKYFYLKDKYKIFNFRQKKKYDNYNLCVDKKEDILFISRLIKKKGIFATWKNYVKK